MPTRPDGERTPDQLTKRASLTSVGSVLRNASRAGIQFAVLPIVIRGLGAELYGVWLVIQQTVGYLVLADFRSTGTLKFTLAIRQHVEDVEEKRRQVGAAIVVWLGTVPLLLVVGLIAVVVLPSLLQVPGDRRFIVRVALAIAFGTLALDRLLSLPAHVLRGMNLEYKSMGLDAATFVAAGIMSALAVRAGWGLIGLSLAGTAGMLLTNACRWVVAKRNLPWLGASRPTRDNLRWFAGLSGWLLLNDVGFLLLMASELMLVGIVRGPVAAAVYATTGAVLRLSASPVAEVLGAGGPGVALLAARGEWARIAAIRSEIYRLSVGVVVIVGAGVLVLNQSFVGLWVGPRLFGGQALNALLVGSAIAGVLYRIDGVIVDAMLEFRSRALVGLAAGAGGVVLGVILLNLWGLEGMALSALVTRAGLALWLPSVLGRRTGRSFGSMMRQTARVSIAALCILGAAFALGLAVEIRTWSALLPSAALVVGGAAAGWWLLGLSGAQRSAYIARVPRHRRL